MTGAEPLNWLLATGVGMLWLGAQIIWVGGVPRAFRPGPAPTAEPGSTTAFLLFWIDQYSWIGTTLGALGLLLGAVGLLQVQR